MSASRGPAASSREKLSRAGEHIERLLEEIEAFFSGFFLPEAKYKLTFESTDEPRSVGVSGNAIPQMYMKLPIPELRWGVLVGDAVHNLRSALDNAVEGLTVARLGAPLPRTCFPIFDDREGFHRRTRAGAPAPGSGLAAIRGLSEAAADVVKHAQPYNAVRAAAHPLWLLYQLSNIDKHRVPAVVAMYGELPGVGLVDEAASDNADERVEILPFHQGLEQAIAVQRGDASEGRKLRLELSFETLFGVGPAEGEPVVPTLKALRDEVARILDELERVG